MDVQDELVRSARELEHYLSDATTAPPATSSLGPDCPTGWYTAPPGARSPWSHMHDVSVTVIDCGVVVATAWADDPDTYVIPLGASDLIAQFQVDRWITMLDLHLDTSSWREKTTRIGSRVRLVAIPDRNA